MILTFRSNALARFWLQNTTRGLPVQNARRVRHILGLLNTARNPGDMALPGLRFHPLGEMAPGRYSVRVSGNYRLTFAFDRNDVVDVDIEDYH